MTRHQMIADINSTLEKLPEERLEMMAEFAKAWASPSMFSSLNETDRAEIDAALDELDRGEGIAGTVVFGDLHKRIAAARTAK